MPENLVNAKKSHRCAQVAALLPPSAALGSELGVMMMLYQVRYLEEYARYSGRSGV